MKLLRLATPAALAAFAAFTAALAGCADRAPFGLDAVDAGAAGARAPDPAVVSPPDATPAPAVDAGPGAGLRAYMAMGLVADFGAAMGRGQRSWEPVAIAGDGLRVDVGYGLDILTLRTSATIGPAWSRDQGSGVPDSIIVGSYLDAGQDPLALPYTPAWLATQIYDALTAVPTTTEGGVAIRESPAGRVHCERALSGRHVACYLRPFVELFL